MQTQKESDNFSSRNKLDNNVTKDHLIIHHIEMKIAENQNAPSSSNGEKLLFGEIICYDCINSLHNNGNREQRGNKVVITVHKS